MNLEKIKKILTFAFCLCPRGSSLCRGVHRKPVYSKISFLPLKIAAKNTVFLNNPKKLKKKSLWQYIGKCLKG
jgi:hypothetical protein